MGYIAIILFCKLLQPLLNKTCSMELSDAKMFMKYMIIRQLAAAVIAALICRMSVQTDRSMLLFGALFALCLTVCTYAGIAAMQCSAMVMVSLFEMAGLLVPCIAGSFLFGEPMKAAHGVGLAACILSAFLLTKENEETKVSLSAKAWILLLLCLLSNGGIMLTQKMFAVSVPEGSIAAFHFWGFLFSALLSLLIYLPTGKKGTNQAKITPKLGVYGTVLSVAMLTISMLSTYVSSLIPAVVLFSAVNGGGLLLCTVVSVFVYREKFTVKMAVGLVMGAAALMMINFV